MKSLSNFDIKKALKYNRDLNIEMIYRDENDI